MLKPDPTQPTHIGVAARRFFENPVRHTCSFTLRLSLILCGFAGFSPSRCRKFADQRPAAAGVGFFEPEPARFRKLNRSLSVESSSEESLAKIFR